METSIFAFASDLLEEGIDTVLGNVQQRAGIGAVLLAAAYHDARDVLPHNPRRRVAFRGGGGLHFRPDPRRWRGVALEPRVAAFAREADPLAALCDAAGRRGLAARAWAVFLHADWLDAGAETATRNAFGDPYLTDLCPANPDVRAYVRALASDIAQHDVDAVLAESLHYHPFDHGYHHERSFVPLGQRTRFLLGLCFCHHCRTLARRSGVDADAVRRFAAAEIDRPLSTGVDDPGGEMLSREEADALAGGEMAGYLEARAWAVTSLVAEAAEEAAAEGVRFHFMDLSGAVKGYATGRPEGEPAPSVAWRLGVDLEKIAGHCDGIEALAYAHDPARVRTDLDAYRGATAGAPLAAALRPVAPDCDSAENLAAKLSAAREAGVERVDFYHYGLMPLPALDRIREALEAAG